MRSIGVVTVARSDYGIYLPLLRKIEADADLQLRLIVSGMHLSPEFGRTVDMIIADGFEVGDQVEALLSSDSPEGIAKSVGLGTIGFAQTFSRSRPDILVVLGDRFEMYAAVLAALPFKIPVAHIHGGEVTQGAIDDALRHSMTKFSHLHFVATQAYAHRIYQLGEESWRVTVSGAPGLDNLDSVELLKTNELEELYGLRLDPPPLLVTFHPVTLEYEKVEWQVGELLAALEQVDMPVVFTMPNADTGGRSIVEIINKFVKGHSRAYIVGNFGVDGYFSMMSSSAAMVGNSSSGIIEAASFKLPVINIGTRQRGRVRGGNVIDVGYERAEIVQGIKRAMNGDFHRKLAKLVNPYGCGGAADIIIRRLKEVELDNRLIIKQFIDLNCSN
jgi:UDP-hydrolysing UDP-N-acetyl-D-glucosamine 2-epimerase